MNTMAVCIFAVYLSLISIAAGIPQPDRATLVADTIDTPAIVSGMVNITWSALLSGTVSNYVVQASPVDDDDDLQDLVQTNVWHKDFGSSPASLVYSNGAATLAVASSSSGSAVRARPAFVVRKVPLGSIVTGEVDCAALHSVQPNSACGVAVVDGGANTTLFSVVSTSSGTVEAVSAGRVVASSATQLSGTAWTAASGKLRVRLSRGLPGVNRSWTAELTPLAGPGSGLAVTNLTVRESSLAQDMGAWTWQEADLWYGFTAYAWGGSASLGSALLTRFHIYTPVPKTGPTTLYGLTDTCLAGNTVRSVSVTVPGTQTWAIISGLSGYFPYTIRVIAVEAGTGTWSAPSRSVPGLYFYPRAMPPRAHMLGFWLDSKYAPGGAIAKIPDASMRGHDLLQPNVLLRPAVTAGNWYAPSTLRFTRSKGHVLATGADGFDLGIGGNTTVYVMARGTTSVPQVLLGRGGPADTITGATRPGWAVAVYNDLYNPYPGFLALKTKALANDQGAGEDAAVKHSWWIPNTAVSYWYAATAPAFVFTAGRSATAQAPSLGDGTTELKAWRDDDPAYQTGLADALVGNTSLGWPGVWWNGSAPVSNGASSTDLAFRVGSSYNGGSSPDTLTAFDGDLYQVLIYREVHDLDTQRQVRGWLDRYHSGLQCQQKIAPVAAGVDNQGTCISGLGGVGSLRCWQNCRAGYQYFLGTWGDHWCSNGAWTGAPLLCRKGCGTAMPPLYASSCYRNIISEDFTDPDSALRYVLFPSLPWPQAQRTWRIVDAPWGYTGAPVIAANATTPFYGSMLTGNTSYGDACARMVPGPSIFGIHPTRWNTDYLPWGTRAFVKATIMLGSNSSKAGLALRLNDQNTYYRAVLMNGPGGLVFERVSGGRATVLGRAASNFSVSWGSWTSIEANFNEDKFTISSNNVTLLTVSDAAGPRTGSVGSYLDGQGTFANMTVNSTCDAFLVGRNILSGMSITYTCRPGYTPLGNGTWTCRDDGTYGGANLICRSRPPVFGNYTFSVPERSPNGTLVGVATAWPAGADQTLAYELVAQYPPPANGSSWTFIVVGCSGAIRVADPYALDYQATTSFNLTLKAVPDGQEISAAYTNVTILVTNVVDPPQLLPTVVYINETQTGPVSGAMQAYNPDKFTLIFEIGAGDINSIFTIDAGTGVVLVKAPGLAYANGDSYDLLISASTVEDSSLVTNGILTVNVIDINNEPELSDETFFAPESLCMAGTFLGVVPIMDLDIQPQWNNATLRIVNNANKGAINNIFSVVSSSGALYFDKSISYSASDPVYWVGDKRARDVFTLDVAACDNGGLCSHATVSVVVLVSGNFTSMSATITGMSWPSTTGMATAGGDVIRFSGRDFPLDSGVVVTADYGSTALGVAFRAVNCFVKSDTVIQCSSAEGYGAGLTWRVFLNAMQVPASATLVTSYAPPTVRSVAVDTTGLSTAGSANAAVTISGDNFGMTPSVVTVRVGRPGTGSGPGLWFTLPLVNSVGHSSIRATLGPGCGADLEVEVTVAGQVSTSLNPSATKLSYPSPAIVGIAPPAGYNLMKLPTTDAITMVITGSNLGPESLPSSLPLTVTATYDNSAAGYGPQSTFSYSVACTKDDVANAHTRIACPLSPGVGTSFSWKLDVCGQQSGPSSITTGYEPPVLTRLSGPGAQRANTEGGQSINLDGRGFGPPCCDARNPPYISAVQYGSPGQWQYSAVACAVTSSNPPLMHCLTGPGTGNGHAWRVNIGGQWSDILYANTSYSPPVLYQFTGAVDDAGTQGGANITILGSNFGDSLSKIAVTYVDRLTEVSSFTGGLPLDVDGGVEPGTTPGTPLPPGRIVYSPPWCVLTVPHKALTCGLQPGGGVGISWVVVVDEQISTAPTTAYGPPRIDTLSLSGGGTVASSDGGQTLVLRGANFGEAHLIQSITYGPTGREYTVMGNFTWKGHFQVDVKLSPAIPMGPFSFLIMVADQMSELSSATISIAAPVIQTVDPATEDTEVDPLRPVLVRVSGIEFGLLDPSAEIAIAFGNAADRTLLPLIAPAGRIPSLLDVTSPQTTGWARPASPVPQTLVFALPSGLGKDRAIHVVAYRRGSPPSMAQVASMATQGPAAVFSYRDPFLDYIVVLPTTEQERNATIVAMGGVQALNGSDPNSIVKLLINGKNFGPEQSVNRDGVARILEENLGGGVTSATPFLVGNWSHTLITAYSVRPSGTVRIRIVSTSADGTRQLEQTSAWASFSDISPAVDAIIGPSTGFATVGGESISILVSGIGNAVLMNVTVGGRRCGLLDGPLPGGRPVLETEARARLIVPQGLPPAVTQWTLNCVLPEGQGTAPVVVVRDGVRSSAATTVTYAPPTVASVATRDADGPTPAAFAMKPWAVGVAVVAPTVSNGRRTVRLEGSNFGTCPSIRVDILPPVRIDACLESSEPGTGRPIITANPSVIRDHSCIEFVAPDGVGTGLDILPPVGWTLTLSAGGQDATNGPLLYRHMNPIVTSISPGTGDTRGGALLTISARQMGPASLVPLVALGNSARAYMPCTGVARLDASTLTCRQPEGSGLLLNARVTVSDLSGHGGQFNYTPPSVVTISVATITGAATGSGNTSRYTYSSPSAVIRPSASALPEPPYLRLPSVPSAGTVLIFDGSSFGPAEPDNCIFSAWADRLSYPWTPALGTPPTNGQLSCNGGLEDFLGEGQVPATDVLEWGHDRVVIRAPRGAGRRVLTIRAGGQAPSADVEYASLLHEPPSILGPCVGLTELNTNGGGWARIPALNVPRPPFGAGVYGDASDMAGTVSGNEDEGVTVLNGGISIEIDPLPNSTTGTGAGGVPWLDLPSPLPLHRGFQAPTEHVVVMLAGRCLTSAVDLTGTMPPFLVAKRCTGDGVVVQSRSGLVFLVPPGVGANKTVKISVYSATGREISSSNAGSFSYDPPVISRVEPSPVYVRLAYVAAGSSDGSNLASAYASQYVLISGKNFGRLVDSEDWTADERLVSVAIAGIDCEEPERVVRLGSDLIQCRLNPSARVGRHNVSVTVGGQDGHVPGDDRGLFIVCASGLYGFAGRPCLRCPVGADCPGFIPDEAAVRDAVARFAINVTAGPVRMGRVQFDVGGLHMGPIPLPGFYNLNHSDAECPWAPGHQDVCIVACPGNACLGDNVCSEAYQSLAPLYRCSSCAKGYFRRADECEKCPANAAAQFLLLILVAITAAAVASALNKYKVNPAFISIGLDFFQVVAIFANSKVKWPAVVKELFYILSAFNLNLELLAPECFLPEVTFANKFGAIMSLPIAVYVLFLLVHGVRVAWSHMWKGQTDWVRINAHLPGMISASLLLLYVLYLYVTKTILDVFNCVPTEPPDGKLYLQAIFEECDKPGGAQMTLYPYAVLCCIVYVFGYPAAVAHVLWSTQELVLEDQLLRAKGVGDDRVSNPHAFDLRRTVGRLYFLFKPVPNRTFWILAILLRKFLIAFVSLIFSRNTSFQMAAALLVLFLAYAAQVRYQPYMSPDEQGAVIRQMLALSVTSPLHNRLRATLASVEQTGRKRMHTNTLAARGGPSASATLRALAGMLMNYNNVDATLLFACCLTCLSGLLYEAARPSDSYYASSRDGVTFCVMFVIVVASLYWAAVMISDISAQISTIVETRSSAAAQSARAAAAKKLRSKLTGGNGPLTSAGSFNLGSPISDDVNRGARMPTNVFSSGFGGPSTGSETTTVNPMFTRKDGQGAQAMSGGQAVAAVAGMLDVPDLAMWNVIRQQYLEQHAAVQDLGAQLSAAKADVAKLKEAVEIAGLSGMFLDPREAARTARAVQGQAAALGVYRQGRRKDYGQTMSDDNAGADAVEEARLAAMLLGQAEGGAMPGGTKGGGFLQHVLRGQGGFMGPPGLDTANAGSGPAFGSNPMHHSGGHSSSMGQGARVTSASGSKRSSIRLFGFEIGDGSALSPASMASSDLSPSSTGPVDDMDGRGGPGSVRGGAAAGVGAARGPVSSLMNFLGLGNAAGSAHATNASQPGIVQPGGPGPKLMTSLASLKRSAVSVSSAELEAFEQDIMANGRNPLVQQTGGVSRGSAGTGKTAASFDPVPADGRVAASPSARPPAASPVAMATAGDDVSAGENPLAGRGPSRKPGGRLAGKVIKSPGPALSASAGGSGTPRGGLPARAQPDRAAAALAGIKAKYKDALEKD